MQLRTLTRSPFPPHRRASAAGPRRRAVLTRLALLTAALAVLPRPAARANPSTPTASAGIAKSAVDLQPLRRTTSIPIDDGAGASGRATLIDLDPRYRTWYLLDLAWDARAEVTSHHLENADPEHQQLRLDPAYRSGIVVMGDDGAETRCELWSAQGAEGLAAATLSSAPYAPLCDERFYLREPAEGRRTAREWTADLLRDHVWGGERITDLVRDTLFKDAWLETSRLSPDSGKEKVIFGAPRSPRLAPGYGDQLLDPADFGLATAREPSGRLGVGHWYPVLDQTGIFVSAVTPRAISPEVLAGIAHPVMELDGVEDRAVAYLMAFDLDAFDLGFSLGTEHPRVNWSDHMTAEMRDDSLPGPDGIGTIAPLVRTGMLSPAMQGRVVATFTGGFKRTHGAMRWGELAHVNHGSHYGFVENGVILSRLQPGLATAAVLEDGRVELETWKPGDARVMAIPRFARQNGVALIERGEAGAPSQPGALVTDWGAGNWSGSEDKKLRTLRSGLCLLEDDGRRFLVYGYFSSATPSAMATVFQGYGCRYAMLLDMNALEHTYLALYHRQDSNLMIQHLIQGMNVLDKASGDHYLPRFVAFPDNRDFFYLLRKRGS